jgi:hypothetical protein
MPMTNKILIPIIAVLIVLSYSFVYAKDNDFQYQVNLTEKQLKDIQKDYPDLKYKFKIDVWMDAPFPSKLKASIKINEALRKFKVKRRFISKGQLRALRGRRR